MGTVNVGCGNINGIGSGLGAVIGVQRREPKPKPPAGPLGGRQVSVCRNGAPGGMPGGGQPLGDSVGASVEKLFPNASKEKMDANVELLLPSGDKSLSDRDISVPGQKEKVSAPGEHDDRLIDAAIARLQDAAVREVSGERLKNAIQMLNAISTVSGVDASAAVAALEKAQAQNKALGRKSGRELAESWAHTLNDDPAHPGSAKARFVETAADANAEAASLLTDFINAVHGNPGSQLSEDAQLAEDVRKMLGQLEDVVVIGLTRCSRDIVRLAEDMRELSLQVAEAKANGTESDREAIASGSALLKRTFTQLARTAAADANAFEPVRKELNDISLSLVLLDGSGSARTKASAGTLIRKVENLQQELFAIRGGNAAMKRELVKTLSDARAALAVYWRAVNRSSLSGYDDVLRREGASLRQPPVLLSVFQGRFDTDFYLHCRDNGIPAEMIDPTFASSRVRQTTALGNGVYNTVYATEHIKLGAYDQTQSGVFKLDKVPPSEGGNVLYGYGSPVAVRKDSPAAEKFSVCKINYATQKAAKLFFGVSDRFVDVSAGFRAGPDGKTFGFIMDRAPGRTLRTSLSDTQKQNGQAKPDRAILRRELRGMSRERQISVATQIMLQGNDLDWSDYLTGQVDRHFGNMMLDLDSGSPRPHVTLTGIDNDMSFSPRRIGLFKFQFPNGELNGLIDKINEKGSKRNIPPLDGKKIEKALTEVKDGQVVTSLILDLSKVPPDCQWLIDAMAVNSMHLPSFITSETLAHLEKMHAQIDAHDKDKTAVDPFGEFSELIPESGLRAMRQRFDELYDHAQALKNGGRVVSREAILRADPAQAERNLETLLECAKTQQAGVDQYITTDVGRSCAYDFGYEILCELGFFWEGGADGLRLFDKYEAPKLFASPTAAFQKFEDFAQIYNVGLSVDEEIFGDILSTLGGSGTRAQLRASVLSLFAGSPPPSVKSALDRVPLVNKPLSSVELNTVMHALREYSLEHLGARKDWLQGLRDLVKQETERKGDKSHGL